MAMRSGAIPRLDGGTPESDYFLLKTFSMKPFQGQYPTREVRIKQTPTTMDRGFQRPAREKPAGMRIAPKIIRATLSPFPTFFEIAINASFSPSGIKSKN
jgi:hypothetical protein